MRHFGEKKKIIDHKLESSVNEIASNEEKDAKIEKAANLNLEKFDFEKAYNNAKQSQQPQQSRQQSQQPQQSQQQPQQPQQSQQQSQQPQQPITDQTNSSHDLTKYGIKDITSMDDFDKIMDIKVREEKLDELIKKLLEEIEKSRKEKEEAKAREEAEAKAREEAEAKAREEAEAKAREEAEAKAREEAEAKAREEAEAKAREEAEAKAREEAEAKAREEAKAKADAEAKAKADPGYVKDAVEDAEITQSEVTYTLGILKDDVYFLKGEEPTKDSTKDPGMDI